MVLLLIDYALVCSFCHSESCTAVNACFTEVLPYRLLSLEMQTITEYAIVSNYILFVVSHVTAYCLC